MLLKFITIVIELQSLCNAFFTKIEEVFFFVITEDTIIISVTLNLAVLFEKDITYEHSLGTWGNYT